jgi:hypothetical protein
VKPLHEEYVEHGTKDMKLLREMIYDDIAGYRAQGFELNEIKTILSFDRFLDTYLFVPVGF